MARHSDTSCSVKRILLIRDQDLPVRGDHVIASKPSRRRTHYSIGERGSLLAAVRGTHPFAKSAVKDGAPGYFVPSAQYELLNNTLRFFPGSRSFTRIWCRPGWGSFGSKLSWYRLWR